MSKKKRLLVLIGLFLLFGGIYWGVGNTPLTLPVTYLYYALCLILSVLYLLVAGGLRPILEKDREKEEAVRKKYLADKGTLHPIKRKDKYRRFRIRTKPDAPEEKKSQLSPPNLLSVPEEKREKIRLYLLLLVIPFYLIFLLDFLYLRFFI